MILKCHSNNVEFFNIANDLSMLSLDKISESHTESLRVWKTWNEIK